MEREARATCLGMGTAITSVVYGPAAEKALAAASRETERLEKRLSRFLPGSDVDRLNRSAGRGGVRLGRDAFAVLTLALACARNTDGCFDVTVGPLVRLWNDCAPQVPAAPELERALALTGYGSLRLRRFGRFAALAGSGRSVDLGGIGKGYAADRAIRAFRKRGATSAYVDFGGDVVTLGARPDGSPWRIGIRNPRRENGLVGVVSVTGGAVVTSGDDQRYFIAPDGRRCHHILNPVTGMPAETGLASVTVVTGDAAQADALATALFTAGMARGLTFLARYPGAQAVFVDQGASVFVTSGLRDRFQAAAGVTVRTI